MNVITREQLSPEQKKRNLYERQKQLLDTFLRNLTRNGELEEGTELFFVPQPTNPYDNNCILVNTSTGQTLGTLSKEMAATITPQIKQGYTFKVHVSAQTGGDIGYAYGINILVERYR